MLATKMNVDIYRCDSENFFMSEELLTPQCEEYAFTLKVKALDISTPIKDIVFSKDSNYASIVTDESVLIYNLKEAKNAINEADRDEED